MVAHAYQTHGAGHLAGNPCQYMHTAPSGPHPDLCTHAEDQLTDNHDRCKGAQDEDGGGADPHHLPLMVV